MITFEWVMSVDVRGKWLTVNGQGQIDLMENGLRGELKLRGDEKVYHYINAHFYEEHSVEATLSSELEGVESFVLSGTLFHSQEGSQIELITLVLTDGSTVLALSHGPRSGT